jgi:hypothetical protein
MDGSKDVSQQKSEQRIIHSVASSHKQRGHEHLPEDTQLDEGTDNPYQEWTFHI